MTMSKKKSEFLTKEEALRSLFPKVITKYLFYIYCDALNENHFSFNDFYLLEF